MNNFGSLLNETNLELNRQRRKAIQLLKLSKVIQQAYNNKNPTRHVLIRITNSILNILIRRMKSTQTDTTKTAGKLKQELINEGILKPKWTFNNVKLTSSNVSFNVGSTFNNVTTRQSVNMNLGRSMKEENRIRRTSHLNQLLNAINWETFKKQQNNRNFNRFLNNFLNSSQHHPSKKLKK